MGDYEKDGSNDNVVKEALIRLQISREELVGEARSVNEKILKFETDYIKGMSKPGELVKPATAMENFLTAVDANHQNTLQLLAGSCLSDEVLERKQDELMEILADVGSSQDIASGTREPTAFDMDLYKEVTAVGNRLKSIFSQGKKEYSDVVAAMIQDISVDDEEPSEKIAENSLGIMKRRYEKLLTKFELLELNMQSILVQW